MADEHGHEGDKHADDDGHADHAEGEPSLLRLDPAMLADLRITTAPAEARRSGDGFTALGEIQVDQNTYAEIGTPVAARVVDVLAGAGERVRAGQPLIALSSPEVGRARADVVRARARAQLARQTLERKRRLAAEKIAPQRELDAAEAAARAATAEVQAAETNLVSLGIEASATPASGGELVLRAPVAGVVLERNAVRGQMADPAVPLLRIADLARLWLVVHAFERDAVRITTGAMARATLAALPGRTFAGKVAWIGDQVDPVSRTIPVRIELDNPGGLLRPGMSATAWLPLGSGGDTVVAVPAAALQRSADGWCVFAPRAAGAFEQRAVGRGRDLGGEIEILSGLEAGETVVVDGAFLLRVEADRARGEGEHHDH